MTSRKGKDVSARNLTMPTDKGPVQLFLKEGPHGGTLVRVTAASCDQLKLSPRWEWDGTIGGNDSRICPDFLISLGLDVEPKK